MRALIVYSGQNRGSLAAVRGLARAGWTVGAGAPTRAGLTMLSRYVRHRHLVPSHASGEGSFLEGIDQAIAERGYDVVFACSDGEILTLSRERKNIRARVPHPAHEVMLRAIDKVDLGTVAQTVGLAIPPHAASGEQARERWGTVPLIVKESLHGTPTDTGTFTHLAPEAFTDASAVDQRVQEIVASGAVPVLQPLIEGRLLAFSSVADGQGRLLGRVQQVAERTYPRRAGLSARARTVPIDELLSEQVGRLLSKLGWVGLSELQFIQPIGSPPMLIDFNGRFYGSLALALAAGVNLPDIWAKLATDRGAIEGGDARPGVRFQWLEGDLQAAREESQGSLRDVAGCLRYATRAHGSISSATDPLPGLLTAGTLASQVAKLIAKSRTQVTDTQVTNSAVESGTR